MALQALCCLDVQGPRVRQLVEEFIDDSREPEDTVQQGRQLLEQVWSCRAECDVILSRYARNWHLSRLALVDRNILRLAVAEMRLALTPHKVAIAEAIKLAQEFSSAESPRFVNGVLDAVAKDCFAADRGPAEPSEDKKEQPEGQGEPPPAES